MRTLIIVTILVIGGFLFYKNQIPSNLPTINQTIPAPSENVEVIATNLDTPWGIAFLPDNSMLVTERKGAVRLINNSGELQFNPVATINNVREIGEGGLLGITLDPNFNSNNYVYLYYTYSELNGATLNRVVRMTYQNNQLTNEQIIVNQIPGASNHNGGRIKFGPDNMLYVGTGDAGVPSRAQDVNSLAGKILRVNNGKAEIYSLGHRNVQGLTWDQAGQLWATEHGPSGSESCCDEVNKIDLNKNYGWPDIRDTQTKDGMVTPIKSSGSTTWAPSGVAYLNENLYFGALRGSALMKFNLQNLSLEEHFKGEFGRIRDVVVGPDQMLYITTSNQDGRGNPTNTDDRIIKINPITL